MLGRQERWQEDLFVAGPLRDLIPDDHILKRVDRVLDLSWLRGEVCDCYDARQGRPGIDPEAAVRLMSWADLHGYSRLVGSLNPAAQPPLPPWIHQRHYVGGKDQVVPKEIVARGPIAPETLIVLPAYDHTCCWEAIWPQVLQDVDESAGPGG